MTPVYNFYLYPEDYDRYLPKIERENYSSYLRSCQRNFEALLADNCHPESLLRLRTRMVDQLILQIFSRAVQGEKLALLAQGGYGREEMNLHSDIDLLFLHGTKKEKGLTDFTEKMLYPLWDLGLEVGYAVRTIGECKKLFFEDVTIMTALLDARHLAGDKPLADQLFETIDKELKAAFHQKKLMKLKIDEWRERTARLGGSEYLLEPNIRDSLGGLRDIQLLVWLAKIQGMGRGASSEIQLEALRKKSLVGPKEFEEIVAARYFLWRIRNELHLLVGKKSDLLSFAYQETIAHRLGYRYSDGILAVECFMQDYYRTAHCVALISEGTVRRMTWRKKNLFSRFLTKSIDDKFQMAQDQLLVRRKNIFERDPVALMKIFEKVQQTGLSLHPETKDLIRGSLGLVDDPFRAHPEAIGLFRAILNRYENLGKVLFAMHETEFLGEWIPEFKKVLCRVQHDIYHIYTIDTHSLFAVNELSKLYQGEYGDQFTLFRQALQEVKKPELLTLGLFLHDIGKGEGGNHSVKGAGLANQITQRLQFRVEEQKTVEFLVLSHLMMPHLSQRRDLEDPELIIQFARAMGESDLDPMDRLNMLFCLTWADIRAVGPNTWTDWKGVLLERLYIKTREVITKGEFSIEQTRERLNRVRMNLLANLGERYNRDEVQLFLSLMPPRYFFASGDEDIDRHFQLLMEGRASDVAIGERYRPDQNLNEIMIYTINTPRVLSQVTGVMLAYAVNILRVDAFPITDGRLLVVVGVTNAIGQAIPHWEKFGEIEKILKEVLFGKMKVEELIQKRELPYYMVKKPLQKAEARVLIDNDVSAYYTVIDVYAHDRLGLLYEIMTALISQGCYVDVSKISTKVEQVADVFYVKDIFGKKIVSPEKLRQIKEALLGVVNKEL